MLIAQAITIKAVVDGKLQSAKILEFLYQMLEGRELGADLKALIMELDEMIVLEVPTQFIIDLVKYDGVHYGIRYNEATGRVILDA